MARPGAWLAAASAAAVLGAVGSAHASALATAAPEAPVSEPTFAPEPDPAADPCPGSCGADGVCWREQVECLLAAGQARVAIERLKPGTQAEPARVELALLLARAYLADDNPFWAQRTLFAATAASPDCGPPAWLAWIQLKLGDPTTARETLSSTPCAKRLPDEARWLLFDAYLVHLGGDTEAAADRLAAFGATTLAYPEDAALWRSLRARDDPGFVEPLSLSLQAQTGASSNGQAGSPTDPAAVGAATGLGRVQAFARFVLPLWATVRPVVEAGAKAHGLTSVDAKKLSYLELSARPGLLFGRDLPRVFVGYHADLLLLNNEEEVAFYEGHRLEIEVEIDRSLTAFAGGGYRVFRDAGRSRGELDGGVGWGQALGEWGDLLLAGSVRIYDAVGAPYDQLGASALAALRVRVPNQAYLRLGATLGVDSYFGSGGRLGLLAYGTGDERLDFSGRLSAGLWSGPYNDVRLGLSYELGWRDSSADQGLTNYDYIEHRALVGLKWNTDLDPFAPKIFAAPDHVPLDYGGGGGRAAVGEEERIQDLLRQDEAARRGSSCVN